MRCKCDSRTLIWSKAKVRVQLVNGEGASELRSLSLSTPRRLSRSFPQHLPVEGRGPLSEVQLVRLASEGVPKVADILCPVGVHFDQGQGHMFL